VTRASPQRPDPRVDAYIAKAAPFARPLLEEYRDIVRAAAPMLREEIKWGIPYWVGSSLVCGMAAFKRHVSLGFWRGGELPDPKGLLTEIGNGKMTSLRIPEGERLPSRAALTALIKAAVVLDAKGPSATPRPKPRPVPPLPPDLAAALASDRKAKAAFDALAPSHRREYIEWITEAKRDATRATRIAKTLELLRAGTSRTQ
jgi:uncharacterized protein YdeI (YjbR/CyaY-like superfamily)